MTEPTTQEDSDEDLRTAERRLRIFTAELLKPKNISRLRNLETPPRDQETGEDEGINWEELLVEFSFEVVSSFNIQFCEAVGTNCSDSGEKRIISDLAEESVSRILSQSKHLTPSPGIESLTQALLKGRNPREIVIEERELKKRTLLRKKSKITAADIFNRPTIYSGGKFYRNKNYKEDEKQGWMFHRHLLPGEDEKEYRELKDPRKEDYNNNDLYLKLQEKKDDLLKDLNRLLYDDTEKIENAKRRLKTFTSSLWDNIKLNIEETIKQANNSAYVPVDMKTKVAAYGVDKALNGALMLAPITGIGAWAAKQLKNAALYGGSKLVEKRLQNVGSKGAKNAAENIGDFKHYEKDMKEILIEFSFELFKSYNIQFCEVIDCSEGREARLMLKLADEVIGRIFNHLSQETDGDTIKDVEHLTKAFLDGKNPNPRDIEPREFLDTFLRKTDNTGITTSDIFKRPGIYKDGQVFVRNKYKGDPKQSKMYHRHLLPGEQWGEDTDHQKQEKEKVFDLCWALQAKKEEIIKDLTKHLQDKYELIMNTIAEATETIGEKVDEAGNDMKDEVAEATDTIVKKVDDVGEQVQLLHDLLEKDKSQESIEGKQPSIQNVQSGSHNVHYGGNIVAGNLNQYFGCSTEPEKKDGEKLFQDQVKLYRNQILNTDNNNSLRTKLDQLNIADKKCHVKRKFTKSGEETELTSEELLENLKKSKTSLVSAPSGSGKSTIAASITEQWAKSEDSSYDLVLFLSSLHTAEKSALQRMVWGEYTSTMREESKFIYQEMEERKGKILIIIDGLGNDILGYKLRSNQLICL